MMGSEEADVTYPQFYRLSSGNLLFLYRLGRTGNANLIMNYYDNTKSKWSRRQSNLIDGEGKRSAYWDMSLDKNGVLHLAWVWRESPDVASNHDIAYAQSKDEGKTWQTIAGKPQAVPITLASADVVVAIPENSNLMNPPTVAADDRSQPFIANYWSNKKNQNPGYHIVHYSKNQWHIVKGPQSTISFSLAGQGTKRPPLSRASLLVENNWSESWVNLIYRDDAQQGKIIAARLRDLTTQDWQYTALSTEGQGAWEPSFDPAQWARMKQAHMLVQNVQQLDGNDSRGANAAPSPLSLLVWSPSWEALQDRHQARKHESATRKLKVSENTAFDKKYIIKTAKRVAAWHWAHIPPTGWHYHLQSWAVCPLYIGAFDFGEVSGKASFQRPLAKQTKANNYEARDNNHYDADDYCVNQAYLREYLKHKKPQMLAPSLELFDKILKNPSTYTLDWGFAHSRDRWSWSDSLFMGPMSWLLAWKATGDTKYLDFMNREWWATSDRLFSEDIGLFFRDESYFDLREQNGKTVHWARGTAWSVAGLVQILDELPKSHPDYSRYLKQFQTMAAAFYLSQQADGLWRPGVLDPKARDIRETSGSAFIGFALASGLRQGLISEQKYLPVVKKTWLSLLASVDSTGKLRDVQPIGVAPHDFDPDNAEPFAGGAFLLLAKELLLLKKMKRI